MLNTVQSNMHPKNCTSLKVRKFDRLLARQYDQAMAAVGLKATQFSLLSNVREYGPISLTDLAAKMVIEPSTMTRSIKLLQKEGWVKQVEGEDARSRLVSVTAKGIKKQASAISIWEAQQQHILDAVGEKKLATLHQLIDESMKLLKRVNEVNS